VDKKSQYLSHIKLVKKDEQYFAVKIYTKKDIAVKESYVKQVLNESQIHSTLKNSFVINFQSHLEDSHHIFSGF